MKNLTKEEKKFFLKMLLFYVAMFGIMFLIMAIVYN